MGGGEEAVSRQAVRGDVRLFAEFLCCREIAFSLLHVCTKTEKQTDRHTTPPQTHGTPLDLASLVWGLGEKG